MQTDTSVLKLDINLIIPNKYQPRKVFEDNALNSLAESIKNYGIINPILVRKKDDKYEIIAGERRFRAAKKIGLTEVPVIVKNADEQEMAELALIENLERQGLTPIEEAKSYEEIMKIGNQTQASLATKLGKSQSSIANKIRLLSLPSEIQEALSHKKISERHARSLINVEDKEKQLEILNRIINEKLTVKETEQIIKEKEITEEEIKQAISDIMKSLNINDEDKEEKEDDNMNNGNFFPNFDNNNAANNNASLNMMNMQSMNQAPIAPAPEMVMPTLEPPMQEPQLAVPTQSVDMQPQMVQPEVPAMSMNSVPNFDQFGPTSMVSPDLNMNNNINNNINPMDNFNNQQDTLNIPTQPVMGTPMMNESTQFGPTPIVDTPLFNPELMMQATINEMAPVPETPMMTPNTFEVPVMPMSSTPGDIVSQPVDKLSELQNILSSNGYIYKIYSNDTDNCIIIELPRN